MIVLSSPKPLKVTRIFSVSVGILAALGIVFTGLVAFTQLPEAWQNPDRWALCLVILQLIMGLLGTFGAVWQLTSQITVGNPRQCLAATEETLAIKTVRKPILFLKRRDCIALAFDGKTLVMADGKAHVIHVYGAKAESVEAFIDSLYELWWPGLTRAEVRTYLREIAPPKSKWRMLPLFAFVVPILFIPTFSMWESVWIPATLFIVAFTCFMILSIWVTYRFLQIEKAVRFSLIESNVEAQDAEWQEGYEPTE